MIQVALPTGASILEQLFLKCLRFEKLAWPISLRFWNLETDQVRQDFQRSSYVQPGHTLTVGPDTYWLWPFPHWAPRCVAQWAALWVDALIALSIDFMKVSLRPHGEMCRMTNRRCGCCSRWRNQTRVNRGTRSDKLGCVVTEGDAVVRLYRPWGQDWGYISQIRTLDKDIGCTGMHNWSATLATQCVDMLQLSVYGYL